MPANNNGNQDLEVTAILAAFAASARFKISQDGPDQKTRNYLNRMDDNRPAKTAKNQTFLGVQNVAAKIEH